MSKRETGWTENKIARYIKEGRGQGEFGAYHPWLTIQDVPSDGRSHRPKGWKTQRIHQLLSDLELKYFHVLEWADDVIDIREQFPILNRDETIHIAEEKRIKHPVDNSTQTPIVLTTDFLITKKESNGIKYFARSTKHSDQLHDKRTLEKLEIEREYWIRKDVSWALVTEKDIEETFYRNMNILHPAYYPKDQDIMKFVSNLIEFMGQADGPLTRELLCFDDEYGLERGSALALFKHLIAKKSIGYDIKHTLFQSQIKADRFIYPEIKDLRWDAK